MANSEEIKITTDEVFRILFYAYGGPNSKKYDPILVKLASDVLIYRLRGKAERPDLYLSLRDMMQAHWNLGVFPERWNGKDYDAKV